MMTITLQADSTSRPRLPPRSTIPPGAVEKPCESADVGTPVLQFPGSPHSRLPLAFVNVVVTASESSGNTNDAHALAANNNNFFERIRITLTS